jgi:hypothetical protein
MGSKRVELEQNKNEIPKKVSKINTF